MCGLPLQGSCLGVRLSTAPPSEIMASRKTHNEDCFRILGQEFDEVNKFIDAYAAKYPPPLFLEFHRKFRHNAWGVEQARKKWGALAAMAAKIHIIRDVELYILKEEFHKAVQYENIDDLFERALNYCIDWQGPLDERWLPEKYRSH